MARVRNYFRKLNGRQRALALLGGAGSIGWTAVFVLEPSFPTPDKLLLLAIFIGLVFGQATQVLLRLGPFVALLLVYESFRGIAPSLNQRVDFHVLPAIDRFLFGELPTKTLQNWWWNGQTQWYDFVFYLPYMLHFVLPFTLAIIIWKTREKDYWRYITAFLSVSFAAFVVFVAYPAAPPWMASDLQLIEPISRISSSVWFALGINDFPSLYNQVSPNPVAAMPSLHAAYATLFAMFVIKFYRSGWSYLVLIYPLLIYVGTVYQGEHYAIDEIAGALLGIAGFYASPYIVKKCTWLLMRMGLYSKHEQRRET